MKKYKVLIVEDDVISAEALRDKVTRMGYEVPTIISTGEEVIKKVEVINPDLILMDIKLSGKLDGIETITSINKKNSYPCIYLSAFSDEAIIKRAKITTPYNYLIKPVKDKELNIAIDIALYKHKLETELKDTQSKFIKELVDKNAEIDNNAKELDNINNMLVEQIKEVAFLNVKLEEANKNIESFSYSVSHDLKAPLRAISGFASIIKENYYKKLDENGKKYCDNIISSVTRMSNLIDSLLEFSRFSRQEIRKQEVDIKELICNALEELVPSYEKEKLEIKIKMLPSVFADHDMLYQVIINLLSNAIKYSSKKEKAVIEFGYDKNDNEIIYFIKDNGVGFDPEYADKLFGVFKRLHSESEFHGIGIGLANVKSIIQKHGGRVWAESKLGEGTTFYFSLPQEKVLEVK